MPDLFDNPTGLMGVRLVEFVSPAPNEQASKSTGRIEEFLMQLDGESIQHFALHSDDLTGSDDALRASGVPMLTASPATHCEAFDERSPSHGQRVEDLRGRGHPARRCDRWRPPAVVAAELLRGPLGAVFFEFIQRKGQGGFGEGNFKSLFESMELDQLWRGVITAA